MSLSEIQIGIIPIDSIISNINNQFNIDDMKLHIKNNCLLIEDEDFDTATECSICLESFENENRTPCELPCKHIFDFKSICKYFTLSKKITCPICREKITNYSIRKQNLIDEITRLEKSEDPAKEKKIGNLKIKISVFKSFN